MSIRSRVIIPTVNENEPDFFFLKRSKLQCTISKGAKKNCFGYLLTGNKLSQNIVAQNNHFTLPMISWVRNLGKACHDSLSMILVA